MIEIMRYRQETRRQTEKTNKTKSDTLKIIDESTMEMVDNDTLETANDDKSEHAGENHQRKPRIAPEILDYENTLIISSEGIRVKAKTLEKTYKKTINTAREYDMFGSNRKAMQATELEHQQYLKVVRKNHENKYMFLRKLVSGGMGAILKVVDHYLQRPLAMKVILPALKHDKRTINEFIKEAKITGLLEHPNIIPVHELGMSDKEGLFFTMKLAQGEPLNSILAKIKKGMPAYVEKYNMLYMLTIFRKVCDAISFAHSQDIIHQDIKPHNVIVGDYGEVLAIDWGLACYIGNLTKEKDPVRREILRDIFFTSSPEKNYIQGSPAYMSPEQARSDSHMLDKQTDIFLLCATLYHMFTLESPYTGANINNVLHKAEHRDLTAPQVRNPDQQIPEELCRIIMKGMALKKEDRHHSVQELIADVDDVIAGKWSRREKKVFAQGQLLMQEGEIGQEAYLITKGSVQVFKKSGGGTVVLGILKRGDIVGEMAIITNDIRSASVEAIEDTEVDVMTKELLAQNLKKLPPHVEKIVSSVTRRLQAANTLIHPHMTRDCTPFVIHQLFLILKYQYPEKQKFSISNNKMAARISVDLGIPVPMVEKAFQKAVELKLLSIEQDNILIKDIEKISLYCLPYGSLVSEKDVRSNGGR